MVDENEMVTTEAPVASWEGPESEIGRTVAEVREQTLGAYRSAPKLVEEHANIELRTVEGGYGRRQLFELIQNGADELLGQHGRIEVVLTEDALYCANEGNPLSREGITALLFSNLSAKTGPEIGRFGLGFKSVLGVSSTPEIFSRTGSVRFDKRLALSAVEETVGYPVERVPTLRLAEPLNPQAERAADAELDALMRWAVTVVRLGRDVEDTSWLSASLREFPAEFLLFSPQVEELVLRDKVDGRVRTITATHEGDVLRLREGGDESSWRVFSTLHTPSPRAKRDGGTMAMRDEIPLSWAVPVRYSREHAVGTFWAFFPTYERTTLSGILNAPWKLSEDRARLIEKSPFNQELIEAACDLVLWNLDHLAPDDDPGLLLDLLPARGRELRGWADQIATQKINSEAGFYPCVPDQNGELQLPATINVHPQGIPRQALAIWASAPNRPVDWAHRSVETRDRRATLEMYLTGAGRVVASTSEWLEAITHVDDAADSGCAVRAAAAVVTEDEGSGAGVYGARILLDDRNVMRPLSPGDIFIPAPTDIEADVRYVHPDLLADEAVVRALSVLGIHQVDSLRLLEAYVSRWSKGWGAEEWDAFWDLVRRCDDIDAATALLKDHGFNSRSLAVRTRAGGYTRLTSVLLPGDIVSDRSVEDAPATVDVGFHSHELPVLRTFGAVPSPVTNGGRDDEPWFAEYKREAVDRYLNRLKGSGASPNREYLDFRKRPFAGPASPLRLKLSKEARSRLTHALLQASSDLDPWTFCHLSQSRYPEMPFDHPVVWLIRQRGLLRTSLGVARVALAVAPELTDFRLLLPVAEGVPRSAARALRLPAELSDLTDEHWEIFFTAAAKSTDDRTLARAYSAAARAGQPAPSALRCRVGAAFDERPPAAVAVTADEELAQILRQAGGPHLLVTRSEDAQFLVDAWGLRSEAEAVRSELRYIAAGEEEPLIDLFPILRHALDEAQMRTTVVPCSELRVETFTDHGTTSVPRLLVSDGSRLLRHVELQDGDFLREISATFGLGLGDAQIVAVLRNVEDQRTHKLREAIRKAEDDVGRVLTAVGPEALRTRVPASLIAAAERINEGPLSDRQIGQLALAVHGVEVLQAYRDVLEERGLNPPLQWAGRRKAVAFVTDLGFGSEYAGFEKASLDPIVEVEGTPDVPPLHDFQIMVVEDMRELLRGDGGGLRGLLSLPTGAGKTRVTVQALIEAMADGEIGGPILWIAQTEELCEQAVQTWSELWRGLGPRRRLTISRLWSHFGAAPAEYGEQVVVATIQKLDASVFDQKSYEWLRESTQATVVDEAHTSIGTAYTQLLDWLGMSRNVDRIPLIGLTATPFRNTSEEETKRLAARYGHRRLDERALGHAEAYPRLQELGILSRVDHRTLEGQEMRLSTEELERLRKLRQLSPRATQELGANVDRNRTLLDDIGGLDPAWPVLLFAASVEHAQIMAALLTREGISAAAITGEMDRGARRHYIKQFRTGDLRVLTNFNVLTAGFDAPKVRALYIARPTYSPNAYQQMVGRGLRGPRNGGTEHCLLVNVEDNVANFGEQLAFHDFDYLWKRPWEQS